MTLGRGVPFLLLFLWKALWRLLRTRTHTHLTPHTYEHIHTYICAHTVGGWVMARKKLSLRIEAVFFVPPFLVCGTQSQGCFVTLLKLLLFRLLPRQEAGGGGHLSATGAFSSRYFPRLHLTAFDCKLLGTSVCKMVPLGCVKIMVLRKDSEDGCWVEIS